MDDETVHLEGDIPQGLFEEMQNKFPASAEGGKRNLLRAVIDDWQRMKKLEVARATGEYPSESQASRE
ncbi:hypothetical protein BVU17_18605 (plasmid) [Haloarcula taiwanensis]|uniref:Uncharacterized protein n=1 Tax=Haloarcula taiwanensis TaxID=1932004 RepID=A0A2H5A4D2_9EURY|nr:hypothetical protein [Haloarcula taiwanensis]AUG49583.1 hypothetical protein BVU17_18605 [Haloarcula taiwanensis]